MNLLSNTPNKADDVVKKIFEGLNEINLSHEDMLIAEKFFDFSKELDLSLLENISNIEIDPNTYINRLVNAYSFIEKQNNNLYYDRYILFFDAILGNRISQAMTYNFSNLEYYYNRKDEKLSELIRHAYAQRYSETEIDAKLAAAFAFPATDRLLTSEFIKKLAQSNPEALYIAFKHYCNSKYIDLPPCLTVINPKNRAQQKAAESLNYAVMARLKLCTAALVYNSPAKKGKYNSSAQSGTDSSKLSHEHAQEMTEFIIKVFELSRKEFGDEKIYMSIRAAMFMAKDFDKRICEMLKSDISAHRVYFIYLLESLFIHTPAEFFDANIEEITEMISLSEDGEFAEECVKYAASYAWSCRRYNNDLGKNAVFMLKYFAEKFPKSFISVMYSLDEVKKPRYETWYSINEKYYCCFYEEFFKILNNKNPKAITDYNVQFNNDILNLVIKTELADTNIAHSEIEKYLRGEAPLSVLEPYYDKLADAFTGMGFSNNLNLVELCMEHIPKFTERYYCLYAVEYPTYPANEVVHVRGNKENRYEKFKFIVEIFNDAHVPIRFRFNVYNMIVERIYSDDESAEICRLLAENMAVRTDTQDAEYKAYCPTGSVFTRKTYVKYLIETDSEKNNNRPEIIKLFGDSSKEVRRTILETLSAHKDFESDVLGLLKAKKAAVRETALDILISWGAENYRDTLLEMAESEKSAKLAEKIRNVLDLETPGSAKAVMLTGSALVDELHKGGRVKKIMWLYQTPAPKVHFAEGADADDKYMQAIMLCYANMDSFGVSEKANTLAKELNIEELKQFSADMLSRWLSDGAQSKKKWVLNFAAIHGGYEIIEVFVHYIKEWSENMRGAIAADAVKALAMNGSSLALMTVDNMAHKFKHKQVKNAAIQALDNAAEALGITADQLGDRIVPDLGFDEQMQRIFDYGTRKFKVYLTPTLELEIFDENDKKLKSIPSPGKRDDEETAKKSNAEFKAMKKQLKNVISIQKMRLETALLADRRWEKSAWEDLFVKNPVMHSFAIGLIWASYSDNQLLQTFRYMEDGSFNTIDEDEYELPHNAEIGLVHPIDLDEDAVNGWKEQLEDYEVTQPIEQLSRPVYRINDDEIGKLDLKRFEGRQINGMSLLGRTAKYGWQKGSVIDGGGFNTFYREDVTKRTKQDDGTIILQGSAAELNFEGMYVGGEDCDFGIETVRFYKPGTIARGSYVYDCADDNKAIPLDKINPRYFSEIVYQLEMITKAAEKKD